MVPVAGSAARHLDSPARWSSCTPAGRGPARRQAEYRPESRRRPPWPQRKRGHLLDLAVGGHLRHLWLAEPLVGSDSLRTVQLAGECLVSGSKRPVNPGLASLQASTETLRVPPRCGAVKYAAAPRAPACGALSPPPENAAIPALSAVLRRSTGRRSWGSRSSRERQSACARRPSPASATTRRSRCLGKR